MSNRKKAPSLVAKRKAKSVKMRRDAWQNALTGLGTLSDKRTSAEASWERLSETDVEEIYAGDDQARKANDLLPKDMVREGFKIISEELDEEEKASIQKAMMDLQWKEKFAWALSWARLYGGSGMILGIGDGVGKNSLDQPLDDKAIKDLTFMNIVNRWELHRHSITGDPQDKNFGFPETYTLQPHSVGGDSANESFRIHHSRLIRFDGYVLPRRKFIENDYWSDSLMAIMKNPLRNYNAAYDSVSVLMNDFSQSVFKIRDLADIVSAEDGEELIKKRVEMVEMSRSLVRATIIDAEDEEWKRETVQMDGIPDILVRLERRLVQASGYPHTVFLGEEPGGGFGHTGKSEQRDYYDYVTREQENKLKQPLKQFLHLLMSSKEGPTGGNVPEEWDIEFNQLWLDDEGEIADNKLKQSQTDKNYIDAGVLDPNEVAISRFSTGEFNHETTLEKGVDRTRPADDFNPPEELLGPALPGENLNHNTDSLEGHASMPKKIRGHLHALVYTDGFQGYGVTGDPVSIGDNKHYHNSKFGPTSVETDGEGHTHTIERPPEGLGKSTGGPV